VPRFSDKCVLVTGGTGSFGHAMVERLRREGCGEIRILSRDELKQEDMRRRYNDPALAFYLGDIRDPRAVRRAMRGVDLVFHAAALKQVPSCEFFPEEAILTNALGSRNVIQAAAEAGASHVVCLSTDKAVYPVNVMGMTKSLMEKVALAHSRLPDAEHTIVCCVRYGNVMYSRGSVIPLFVEQLRRGAAITVTEPSMTRFLLTLESAIDLVLFAFDHAAQGDLFVKKAPACTVADLATALMELFGVSLPIERIGIRHGEKLHETLLTIEELTRAEEFPDYYRVRMDGRSLNYERYLSEGERDEVLLEDYTSLNTRILSVPELKELLVTLPEVHKALLAVGVRP